MLYYHCSAFGCTSATTTKEVHAASATYKDEPSVMESSIAAYVSASLKPLLHFVSTEFISKKYCSSGAELVECVIQLFNANKSYLSSLCENGTQTSAANSKQLNFQAEPSAPTQLHSTFAKCSAGIVSGKNRRDEKYLRDLFNRYSVGGVIYYLVWKLRAARFDMLPQFFSFLYLLN